MGLVLLRGENFFGRTESSFLSLGRILQEYPNINTVLLDSNEIVCFRQVTSKFGSYELNVKKAVRASVPLLCTVDKDFILGMPRIEPGAAR